MRTLKSVWKKVYAFAWQHEVITTTVLTTAAGVVLGGLLAMTMAA